MSKKLVYGVGINDADYEVYRYETINGKRKATWKCPYYSKWVSMLRRCYSQKGKENRPTYEGCTVCDEWLYFSNFKKWMETQEWEGRALDKDFLVEGNKVYNPNSCIFISQKLNNFTTTSGKTRGKYPIGVSYRKKKKHMINELTKPYISEVNNQESRKIYIGTYSTPEEAHQAYLKAKLGYCEDYLEEFKDEYLITKGLTRIKDKIQFYIDNDIELTSF